MRFKIGVLAIIFGGLTPTHYAAAQRIWHSYTRVDFVARVGSLAPDQIALIGLHSETAADERVPWKVSRVRTPPPVENRPAPNFVVVSPSSGVTPGYTHVALNPNIIPYLPPGGYILNLFFANAETGEESNLLITLRVTGPPPRPEITSVLNAASLQPVVSPGEIVSILGSYLNAPPITAQFDSNGLYPTSLGNTSVQFNGTPAPLLYVSSNRIDAMVPYEVAGQQSADVIVIYRWGKGGATSATFTVPITDTAPGIFTATGSGNGPGAIRNSNIVNPSISTVNSAENPAPKGSLIQMFATGFGLWAPGTWDITAGIVILGPRGLPRGPLAPVSLTIGGQPARITYAGGADFEISGKLQIDAIVPEGIESGPQPIVLTIGEQSNLPQEVTVAVR